MTHTNKDFMEQAKIFGKQSSTKTDIISAGEKAIVFVYKGKSDDELDFLRLKRFQQKVSSSRTCVKPGVLPPTSAAARYHSMRVYLQVQQWMGNQMQPVEWGWCEKGGQYIPVLTDKAAAPPNLLKIVRCNCKTGYSNRHCTCKANGLESTNGCGVCRGICKNVNAVLEETEDDTDV